MPESNSLKTQKTVRRDTPVPAPEAAVGGGGPHTHLGGPAASLSPRGSIHPQDGEGMAQGPADNAGHFPAALPSGHLCQTVQATRTPLRASGQTHLGGHVRGRLRPHPSKPAPPPASQALSCSPPPRLVTRTSRCPLRPVLSLALPAGQPSRPFHTCSHSYPRSARRRGHPPVCPQLGLSCGAHTRYMGTWSHTPRPPKKPDSISQKLA